MNLYSIGKPLVALYLRFGFKIQVIGRENVPDQGGALICCNHLSNFDPPLVGTVLSRPLSFVAKEELFKIPLFGAVLRRLNAFPIRRGTGDRGAIRLAMKLLREGHALLIFPEGHRNLKHTKMQHAYSGAGFFALKTNAVVVPCAIIGRYKFRGKMKIVFGNPLNMEELKDRKLKSSEVTAIIMQHIEQLIATHTGSTA